jgi:hypothetical protein
MLRHGSGSFNSSLKEVVPWIFIVLKIPSLSAGFQRREFGPVALHTNYDTGFLDVFRGFPHYFKVNYGIVV